MLRQKNEKMIQIINILEEKNQDSTEKNEESKIYKIIKDLVASLQITAKTEIEVVFV